MDVGCQNENLSIQKGMNTLMVFFVNIFIYLFSAKPQFVFFNIYSMRSLLYTGFILSIKLDLTNISEGPLVKLISIFSRSSHWDSPQTFPSISF